MIVRTLIDKDCEPLAKGTYKWLNDAGIKVPKGLEKYHSDLFPTFSACYPSSVAIGPDGEYLGVALAINTPDIWDPNKMFIYLLALTAFEGAPNNTAGRLFHRFDTKARLEVKRGNAHSIVVHSMGDKTNINYKKRKYDRFDERLIMRT